MIKGGILFDLDGVLIDSETLYTQFWEETEKQYPTGVENFSYVIKGNNLKKILDTYFPNHEIQANVVEMIDCYEDNMQYGIFPGVESFLTELKINDIPCAIVTSSSEIKMSKLFTQHPGFSKYFDAIITGDMVTHSKPNPEGFLLAAEKINCDIKDCYVFEDSPSGIEAGLNSGAKVIGVATTLLKKDINKKVFKIIDNFEGFSLKNLENV